MITVLTPSNRDIGGLLQVAGALRKQTYRDFEWIVGSPEKPELPIDFVWVEDPPKKEGDYWVLNKLYNKMISRAKGELLVSVQDYTYFRPDGLDKFWTHYLYDNKSVVSGVGDKYDEETFLVKTWIDPRRTTAYGSYYECEPNDWEGNYGSIPKAAVVSVGGFDEELDQYAGMDWYSVIDRLDILGEYKFYLDQTNESFSLEHGRYKDWEERNAKYGPYQGRQLFYKNYGQVLNYL